MWSAYTDFNRYIGRPLGGIISPATRCPWPIEASIVDDVTTIYSLIAKPSVLVDWLFSLYVIPA